RLGMWDIIRSLVADGTTILLTTQYLDEADDLADEIVVIDHGQVIAAGTSESLKDRVGGDVVEFTVPRRSELSTAAQTVASIGEAQPTIDADSAKVTVRVGGRGSSALIQAVRELDAVGIETDGLALRRPSLDDVFMALTGHVAEEADEQSESKSKRKGRGKTAAGASKEA
ncbi:MAG: daunorubicin/doxorubicin resistance ABC transporter ATP-binding protein DrrA, partial [Acidimicrobiales bacterium]